MKSETITKLSLPRFAEIVGMNPLHFFGIQIPEIESSTCAAAIFQYEWQTADGTSREEIARAVAEAEADIERLVRYRLLPSWEEAERHETVRPRIREQVFIGHGDLRGFPAAVETDWKHVISGGRRLQTLIEAGAAVAYTNTQPTTTWDDTATVSVTVVAGTTACEIAVYMPGRAGDERYRIRPVQVSISGVTATCTFRRELAVDPALQEQVASSGNFIRPIEGLVDANFVDTVDVYRITNSGETQATLIWFPPNSCPSCGGTGCLSCQEASQTGCLDVRNPRMGQVGYSPATWNAATLSFDGAQRALGRQPDAVDLYYYGGLRDRSRACPLTQMSPDWERAVAALAAARLGRPLCACGSVKAYVEFWQRNAAFSPGDGSSYNLDGSDLTNPLGTRIGEILAWRRVRSDTARVAASA
jgi:hypothetical protein